MKRSSLLSISALAAVSVLTLAGCATDAATESGEEGAASARACVILPDADSGTRWEPGDRPALEKALTEVDTKLTSRTHSQTPPSTQPSLTSSSLRVAV